MNVLIYFIKRAIQSPFALSGRRNRVDYITYQILLTALVLSVWLLEKLIEMLDPTGVIHWLFLFPTIVVFLGAAVSLLAVGGQRCRDIGWPGWAVFFCIIPLAGNVFWVLLLLLPGTEGENKYGSPINYGEGSQFRA
jgi:uncharacterized membrane protein YhaH (DUF805 family)